MKYAKEKGIEVILYVNRRALERQLDEILPLYKKWGVAGLKYGFVYVGSQRWTTWLDDAVAKVAEHQSLVNVHDNYRPTGVSRIYPNLMTQAGILGDEEADLTPEHIIRVIFPRLIAGATDNTVWDETPVLEWKICEYAVFARRSGQDWFIGGMNGANAHDFKLNFDFLDPSIEHVADIYTDDSTMQTETQVKIEKSNMRAGDVLTLPVKANNGFALRLTPRE